MLPFRCSLTDQHPWVCCMCCSLDEDGRAAAASGRDIRKQGGLGSCVHDCILCCTHGTALPQSLLLTPCCTALLCLTMLCIIPSFSALHYPALPCSRLSCPFYAVLRPILSCTIPPSGPSLLTIQLLNGAGPVPLPTSLVEPPGVVAAAAGASTAQMARIEVDRMGAGRMKDSGWGCMEHGQSKQIQ